MKNFFFSCLAAVMLISGAFALPALAVPSTDFDSCLTASAMPAVCAINLTADEPTEDPGDTNDIMLFLADSTAGCITHAMNGAELATPICKFPSIVDPAPNYPNCPDPIGTFSGTCRVNGIGGSLNYKDGVLVS